jgi:DNA-binding transcriptional ArsR family regulator
MDINISQYAFKAQFFKVLAHPLRVRILDGLRAGAISVGELQERLEVEQSTLSQQLSVLRVHNFVSAERQGASVRYSVRDPAIWRLLDSAKEIFDNQLISVRSALEELRREM